MISTLKGPCVRYCTVPADTFPYPCAKPSAKNSCLPSYPVTLGPRQSVSKSVSKNRSWLRHKRPSTDTDSLPTRVTTRYRPLMGHYHRFKRGDLVVIVSGRYEGHQGVVDSAVFQRTVDYPDEFAPGYYRRGIHSR